MKKTIADMVTGVIQEANLTDTEIAEIAARVSADAARVPESISRSQFWQQVEAQGLTAAANQLIDGLVDPLQKIRAREVTSYARTDAQLIAMATALGMDANGIDEFFRQGGAR